ncbi:MAG: ThuA domain-containing protein, partial [Taibaiella sp.]|nr:ThuA domain-containing protein [Taibaiella sp.]
MNRYVCHIILSAALLLSCKREREPVLPPATNSPARVVVLTETEGFAHESIAAGLTMFRQHETAWGIEVTEVDGSELLVQRDINAYDLLVLLNTTGDVFDAQEQVALQQYIKQGGAVLAIHGASDAEYDWPWYGQMLGGWFDGHPEIQEADCIMTDKTHPITAHLPATWHRTDEWYNFRRLAPDNQVLILLDENTYSGGTHGSFHPISWCREFDGGRVFYTGMGHT